MTVPSSRADLLPLIGQRASAEIAALVIPPVVVAAVPDHASRQWAWLWAGTYLLAAVLLITATLAAWILAQSRAQLPPLERVDLYETRGSGAIVSLVPFEELIPV
ncbi:hypothetical protein FKK32_29195 [Klebsiella pneumoniae]|nr:hypothetical protein [Klebsiella pneumoniae]